MPMYDERESVPEVLVPDDVLDFAELPLHVRVKFLAGDTPEDVQMGLLHAFRDRVRSQQDDTPTLDYIDSHIVEESL